MKTKTYLRIANVVQATHDVLACKDVVIECDDSYAQGTVVFQHLEEAIREACAVLYPKRKKLSERVIQMLGEHVEGVFDSDFPKLDFPSRKGAKPTFWDLHTSSVMFSELRAFVKMCDRKYFRIECDEEPST